MAATPVREEKKTEAVISLPEGFTKIREIGEGGFSNVWLVRDPSGKNVAVKVPTRPSSNLIETSIQASLSHPNLLPLVWISASRTAPDIIWSASEAAATDLLNWLNANSSQFILRQRLSIVGNIHCGLKHLHHNLIAHLDLKPDNVLLVMDEKSQYTAKIADYGLSNRLTSSMPFISNKGTALYWAPEMLCASDRPSFSHSYALARDYWAFGATAFVTIFGRLPFGNLRGDARSESAKHNYYAEIVARVGLPEDDWKNRFPRCARLSVSRRPGDSLVQRLLADNAVYEEFKKRYTLEVLREMDAFFTATFQIDPRRRTMPFKRLLDRLDIKIQCARPTVQRVRGIPSDWSKEGADIISFPLWLQEYLTRVPDDVRLYFMSIWNRLKKKRATHSVTQPTWAEANAIAYLAANLLGLEALSYPVVPPELPTAEKGSALQDLTHQFVDALCGNLDGSPWKCRSPPISSIVPPITETVAPKTPITEKPPPLPKTISLAPTPERKPSQLELGSSSFYDIGLTASGEKLQLLKTEEDKPAVDTRAHWDSGLRRSVRIQNRLRRHQMG